MVDPVYLYYMEQLYPSVSRKNFATKASKYELIKVNKQEVENHWFIKNKDFKLKLLCDGKVRYYYQLDDRGIDHLYGKSALYFKIKQDNQPELPIFLGFDTENDTNGVGLFLGGNLSYKDMGPDFDYAVFAQKYYSAIKDARKNLDDYEDFAPWVNKKIKSIIREALLDSNIEYENLANPDPWDFVHIRGLDSVDFLVGLFDGSNGKRYVDNNIILELIGYRLFAAKKNLYKFCFNQDFIAKAYEKALAYIEKGKFGSAEEVPEKGFNEKQQMPVFNMRIDETTELGLGAASVVHIRLDGLSATWNNHLMSPDLQE